MNSKNAEWFMSVAYNGRFIVLQGDAWMEWIDDSRLSVKLNVADGDLYAELTANVTDDSSFSGVVKSGDPSVPDFFLKGTTYGDARSTLILGTDGTTTVGVTALKA